MAVLRLPILNYQTYHKIMKTNMYGRTLKAVVSTIASDTDSLNLIPDKELNPINCQHVSLKLKADVISGFSLPVEVILNGVSVPVYDKAGNVIYGSQLVYGMYLNGYFGTNGADGTDHLSVMNIPPVN